MKVEEDEWAKWHTDNLDTGCDVGYNCEKGSIKLIYDIIYMDKSCKMAFNRDIMIAGQSMSYMRKQVELLNYSCNTLDVIKYYWPHIFFHMTI